MSDRSVANFLPVRLSALFAGIIGLASMTQAVGAPVCRPALAIKDIHFFGDAAADPGAEMDRGHVGRCVTPCGEYWRLL